MIPLRVYLKGFMSYRDEAELAFDGAPLWVLTGRNGAGKSAVFDAITFVLYGKHRAGKQNHTDLINHHADRLVVEFDLSIGPDIYRIKRTVPKKGNSTREIIHLQGLNPPYPGKKGIQPIPGTDKEKGFDDWVAHNIGLNAETFTASVLLQQGKSEAMLEALPSKRHEMLCELVDISAYERLAQKAKAESNKYESVAKGLDVQLNGLKRVNDTEISDLAERITTLTAELEEVRSQLETLNGLKVHAKTWQKRSEEQGQINQALEEIQQLLDNAERIEREARRLAELQTVLPAIKRIFYEYQRLLACHKAIDDQQAEAADQEVRLKDLEPKLAAAKASLEELTRQQEEQQRIKEDAVQTLQNTESDHLNLEKMEELREQLIRIEGELARLFPDDLDKRVEIGQAKVEHLQELSVNLPYLKQFGQARAKWLKAKNQRDAAEERLVGLSEQLLIVQAERETTETQLRLTDSHVQKLRQVVTEANTLLNRAKSNIQRFQEVDGQPNCHYCGQPLTVEHLTSERSRLERVRETAEVHLKEAELNLQVGKEELDQLTETVQSLTQQVQTQNLEVQQVEQQIEHAQQNQTEAETQAEQALVALGEYYRQQITQLDILDITAFLLVEYPTSDDLQELEQQTKQLPQYRTRLNQRLQEQRQRDNLREKQKLTANELQNLETRYSEARAKEIITARQAAQTAKDAAESELQQLQDAVERDRKAFEELASNCEQVRSSQQQAAQQIEIEQTRADELERSITALTTDLPPDWQVIAHSLTGTQLQEWEQEVLLLTGADERKGQILEAEHLQKSYQDRLLQIERDLADIPKMAKRPIGELEAEESHARQRQQELQTTYENAQVKKGDLERQQKTRSALEKEHREANKQARLYKELASLLGRDNLQRFLLQQVEVAIVHNANEVLDRTSGGTLWLGLREAANNTGAAKALDIIAYNSQLGENPLPMLVGLLSGSQRFRVAVSLALGIGRYASQGAKRVESVIIDEGFGGLDKEGRNQMIDELHELKHELNRIILVSHQEEFASAFRDNGYEIRLDNGTSSVIPL